VSIEVKPGRWRMRSGETAVVVDRDGVFAWPWTGYGEQTGHAMSWARDGRWHPVAGPLDLVEYLGHAEQSGGVR